MHLYIQPDISRGHPDYHDLDVGYEMEYSDLIVM